MSSSIAPEVGLVGHPVDHLQPAVGGARLDEDRAQIVTGDALAGEDVSPLEQTVDRGDLDDIDRIAEVEPADERPRALAVLGLEDLAGEGERAKE